MTREFVMRVQQETLFLVMQNAVCYAASATLSCANICISHAWLRITENSLFATQHYRFPDPDIFAFDSKLFLANVEVGLFLAVGGRRRARHRGGGYGRVRFEIDKV